MQGDVNSLLSSSLQIAKQCAADASNNYKALLFECISRAMFMEEHFEEELHDIQSKLKTVVEGILSIGVKYPQVLLEVYRYTTNLLL